ncbi:MAG: phosphatidate cytidylyltransferase [Candidatus Aminicenantes bacterium]|nr:phosphatidate cytidylyltransferase [Candidatus Aminicenantes bacterium]
MSLRQRTGTAAALLALLFVVLQFGPPWLMLVLLELFVVGALVEFYGLAERRNLKPRKALGVVIALLIGLSFVRPDITLGHALTAALLVTAFVYVLRITTLEQLPAFVGSVTVTFFGALYVAFPLHYLYWLRLEKGPYALYFLFGIIFLGDTGAYFIGAPFGRHKMTPVASPKKSWEGAVGGIVFACLGALAARALLFPGLALWKALLIGAVVHAAAQASDPFESLFKRAAGVKDSSNLLPGHGGLLDRVDSFLLAAPLFYYLVKFLW